MGRQHLGKQRVFLEKGFVIGAASALTGGTTMKRSGFGIGFFVAALWAAVGLTSLSCSDDDSAHQAVCGNGLMELGESCDDGAGNGNEKHTCKCLFCQRVEFHVH